MVHHALASTFGARGRPEHVPKSQSLVGGGGNNRRSVRGGVHVQHPVTTQVYTPTKGREQPTLAKCTTNPLIFQTSTEQWLAFV